MLAVGAILVSTSSVATAAEPDGTDTVAVQVADAVSAVGASSATPTSTIADVDVSLPTEAGGDVVIQREDQLPITLGIPDLDVLGPETAEDGTTVFEGVGNTPDISVAHTDTGFRISTVIGSADQPTEFSYALNEGTTAEIQPDGAVALLREEAFVDGESSGVASVVVGRLEPAWAVDAELNPVATHYEVVDGAVIQHVEHNSQVAYPVVADPQAVVTAPLQVRVRWTRGETKSLKDFGYGATALTAACTAAGVAIAGPVGGAVGAGICAVAGVGLVLNASNAYNAGRCLEWWIQFVPLGFGVAFQWYGTYAGGYCR